MTAIKICGITTLADALAAVDCGADALGFVFAASPRQVQPKTVRRIVAELPAEIVTVGVFVDWPVDRVAETLRVCALDVAQLHGQESPEQCAALYPRVLKAFSVRDENDLLRLADYRVAGYLIDRPRLADGRPAGEGRGGFQNRCHELTLARKASQVGPVFLAGGLDPDNVAQAVSIARPYGVDVSSGVEHRPGRKDVGKMRAFIQAVRAIQQDPTFPSLRALAKQ